MSSVGTDNGGGATNRRLILRGVRVRACIATANDLLLGRLVQRHRSKLLTIGATMLGAAAVTAAVQALGMIPAGAPAAFWPFVSAALAAALSTWPRLHLEAMLLVRAVRSAATFMLAAIGALTAAAVFFWDGRDPASAWTLGQAVADLRAYAPAILSLLFTVWVLLCGLRFVASGGSRSGAIRHAVLASEQATRSDRELTARHEAAHALVASVLGLPVRCAWINDAPTRNLLGVGGMVTMKVPPAAQTLEASYGLLARKIAVSVAGVVGECGARPMEEIMRDLHTQRDWTQATELSWFAASLRPGQALVERVLEAVVPALHTAAWTAAIEDGAKSLLRAGSDPVPPDVFAAVARRFGLALPAVEALAGDAGHWAELAGLVDQVCAGGEHG